MPFMYEYYSDDSEEQDRRQTKRRKLHHIRTTKAKCLEDEDQVALVEKLEDEVKKEDAIKKIKTKYHEDIEKINDKYQEDIQEARSQLSASRRRTQRARKTIRDAGRAEFDSLLCVGDSLSYILTFLDIFSIGRCEKTCKGMKNSASPAWMRYNRQIVDRRYTSPFGDTVRERALRFCLASEYARRAQSGIKTHSMEKYERVCLWYCYSETKKPKECGYCGKMEAEWQIEDKRTGNYMYDYSDDEEDIGDDDSCCFPDSLNEDVMNNPGRYDIFMRVTSGTDEQTLFEGFVPQEHVKKITRNNGNVGLDINFREIELRNWPEMQRALNLDIERDRKEWLKVTSDIPIITLLAIPKRLPSKEISLNSLSLALIGCFGHASVKELDEFDEDFDEDWQTHFEGFGFEDDNYHVRVGSVIPRTPHVEKDPPCRYLYLVWSKEKKSNFAGLRIEDGMYPRNYTGTGYSPFW